MERDRAIAITREMFPEESKRGVLDILLEETRYPVYSTADPEMELRAELEDYKPRHEQMKAKRLAQRTKEAMFGTPVEEEEPEKSSAKLPFDDDDEEY